MPPKWPQLATLLIFSILFVLLLLLLVFVITLQVVLSITTTNFILPPTDWLSTGYLFSEDIFYHHAQKICNETILAVLLSTISLPFCLDNKKIYLLKMNYLYWVAKWFSSIYKVSFPFEIDVSSQRIANQLISANWSKSRLLGRLRVFRAFEQIHIVLKCCNTPEIDTSYCFMRF